MFKYIRIVFFITVMYNVTWGQQDPQFTQYYYNMSIINPAYTTNELGTLDLGANYRKQWINSVGGPKRFTFFAHTPLNDKIEMGINFVSDQIGQDVIEVNENNVNVDFAYVLNLKNGARLSMGLKAGFTSFNPNFSGKLNDADDPTFTNLGSTQIFPTVGVGAFYATDQYYIGLSAPNLLMTTQFDDSNETNVSGSEEIHTYLMGGYVFTVNENFKLKPSFMVRTVKSAPVNLDFSLNALLYNRLEAGASYRHEDAISALVGFRITPILKAVFSYDVSVSGFSKYNDGSPEITLLLDLSLLSLKNGYKKSPRFF